MIPLSIAVDGQKEKGKKVEKFDADSCSTTGAVDLKEMESSDALVHMDVNRISQFTK